MNGGLVCIRSRLRWFLVYFFVIDIWLTHQLLQASGHAVESQLIGLDVSVHFAATSSADAISALQPWLSAFGHGQTAPLPLPRRTAAAYASAGDDAHDGGLARAAAIYSGGYAYAAEAADPHWARVYPDFAALQAGGFAQWCGLYDALCPSSVTVHPL